jgi:hypothetical protein
LCIWNDDLIQYQSEIKNVIASFLGISPLLWDDSEDISKKTSNNSYYEIKTNEIMKKRQAALNSKRYLKAAIQLLNQTVAVFTSDSDNEYIQQHCPRIRG